MSDECWYVVESIGVAFRLACAAVLASLAVAALVDALTDPGDVDE